MFASDTGLDPAIEEGIVYQESGQHAVAINAFDQAQQIPRIKYGLYHEAQIPLLEGIISSGMELSDWEMVDERYAYMEHLYRRLYAVDDPRLAPVWEKCAELGIPVLIHTGEPASFGKSKEANNERRL